MPKPKLSEEERKERKRLAEQKRRQKLRSDPLLREEYLRKERERYLKKKAAGVVVPRRAMTLSKLRNLRKKNLYLDSTIKQEVTSADEAQEDAPDLPLDCMLCSKEFNSVSGLKAHVIAHHSYGGVKRKADMVPTSPVESRTTNDRDITCHTCNESFKTHTDLMLHKSCHSEHVCYVCDAKFRTFLQLSRHGPRCGKKRPKLGGHARPPPRPQQLSQSTNKDKETIQTTTVLHKPQPATNLTQETEEMEAKRESPAIENMVVGRVKELIDEWSTNEQETEMSQDNESDNNDTSSQDTQQEVIKLKIIDKPEDSVSSENVKEESFKIDIKIGAQVNDRDKEILEESKSSFNDELKIDSGQEQSENSNETDGANAKNNNLSEDGDKSDSENAQLENRLSIIDGIQTTMDEGDSISKVPECDTHIENELDITDSITDQVDDVNKGPSTQISVESLVEMQTNSVHDPEDESTANTDNDLILIRNPNETKTSSSEAEAINTSLSKNDKNSDELQQSKGISLEIVGESNSLPDLVVGLQSQDNDVLINTQNTNTETPIELKDPIEQEISKLFDEQKSEQENVINIEQDANPVIPENTNANDERKMEVHLAINPLNEDTDLFDADMKITDIESAKSDNWEAKLVTVLSEQSDIEHS